MKNNSIIFSIFVLIAGYLFPSLVFAWAPLTNPPCVWRSLPVPYYVNNSGCADIGGFDPAVSVIETSWDTWENAPCTSWKVSYQGGTGASPMNNSDSLYVLGWIESGWVYGREAIGVTMDYYGGGVIWSSDIAFNGQNYTWSLTGGMGYTVDTQSIITHEMGHFLGLNDIYSCQPDPQTMCGYYSGGTYARTLTDDDIQGVCTLYPGTGPQPECTIDTDCDTNYHCVDGKCIGGMCALCSTHDDCGGAYDYCLAFPDGKSYCGVSCGTNSDCGSGNLCVDLGGGLKQCVPGNFDCVNPSSGCVLDSDCGYGYACQDGICVPKPQCSNNSECPAGYICENGSCVVDTSPHYPVCSQCNSDAECGWEDDMCITFYPDGSTFLNGISYCGVSCDSMGGNCGEGFKCYEFRDKPPQCLPEGHACDTCDPLNLTGCEVEGTYCDFINCGTGICRPGVPGTGKVGDRCQQDTDCETLQCVEQKGGSFCSASCSYQGGWDQCYSWVEPLNTFTCEPRDYGACGYCSCSSGRLGDFCRSDSDCQSGSCLMLPDGGHKVCSYMCSGMVTCPSFFSCRMAGDGSGISGCFPDIYTVGQSCNPGELCLGGWCDDTLKYCTRSCEGNCQCPISMHCETRRKDEILPDGSVIGKEEKICVLGGPPAGGCGSCAAVGVENNDYYSWKSIVLLFFILGLILVIKRKNRC